MLVRLTGYFKFSPPKTVSVRVPDRAIGESLIRHEVGQDAFFTKSSSRDAWNALIGKCAELGWYRNGGWLPNGRMSVRCGVKDRGDILGVCATFVDYLSPNSGFGSNRVWLYCDKAFEREMLTDFFEPDERLKIEVMYTICSRFVCMKTIPSKKWLYDFCKKTHDFYHFTINKFGRSLTDKELVELSEKCPKLKSYIKLMLMPQPMSDSAKTA